MRVRCEVAADGKIVAGDPELLYEIPHRTSSRGLEFSRDGKRILANRQPEPNRTPITVIVGWQPPAE